MNKQKWLGKYSYPLHGAPLGFASCRASAQGHPVGFSPLRLQLILLRRDRTPHACDGCRRAQAATAPRRNQGLEETKAGHGGAIATQRLVN